MSENNIADETVDQSVPRQASRSVQVDQPPLSALRSQPVQHNIVAPQVQLEPEPQTTTPAPPPSEVASPAPLASNLLQNASLQSLPQQGPSVINKQLLSKLNKSLKEKQRIITQKEAKNPMMIQDLLTTSPQLTTLPSGVTEQGTATPSENNLENDTSNDQDALKGDNKSKAKSKRIAKQNSTRTDFFAAKLASAVDDVESSDSDETFVYESNANEFDNENDSGATNGVTTGVTSPVNSSANTHPSTLPTANSGISGPPIAEDAPGVGGNSNVENINHVPPSIHTVTDNISVAGSIRNATPLESNVNSPVAEAREEHPPLVVTNSVSRAESIHSLQSSKWNLRNTFASNTTPPTTTIGRQNIDTSSYNNPYIDQRDARSAKRKNSTNSFFSDDPKSQAQRSPILHFGESSHNLIHSLGSYGTGMHLPQQRSLADGYLDGSYSYDENELSGEEGSSQSELNLVCTDANANNTLTGPIASKPADEVPMVTKVKNSKSSVTSSMLRSTTSKLFDKNGTQPRRYSTIPDDIDIEDFDDELIYYDNNQNRFPYNSHNGSVMNESSSLLNGHKLSHYRSLNLSLNGKKASYPKNKRYLSLGYVPPRAHGSKSKNEVFPFPYSEQNDYYNFDEYDEDAMEARDPNIVPKNLMQGRARLSPSNTRFILPRKVSGDNFGANRMKFVKSFVYTLVSIICILAIGFILGFLLASTKDLSNVSIVSIENALISQDELVFSIVVEAYNPGWFTVDIADIELDVFAKSGYLDSDSPGVENSVETVLLGSVFSFESAISFDSGFFQRQMVQQTGEIKLVGPGKNLTGSHESLRRIKRGISVENNGDKPKEPQEPDNSKKWSVISKHPFDLILRGVLKYDLPMTSNTKSVVVNKVGYVDPSVSSWTQSN